jgi:hypothetical protein
MPWRKDIKLQDYHISRDAYRELLYFCRQYDEKKRELQRLRGLNIKSPDGMPRGGGISDPTAEAGARAAKLSADCDMIELAAKEADPDIARYLLLNVTRGASYYSMDVPASESTFNRARRRFYYLLAKKKGMV